MTENNKLLTFLVAISFLFFASVSASYAATINAASCNYSDVKDSVTRSTYGDTIAVPSGSCTWSSTLTISKGITLQGAGIDQTTITGSLDDNAFISIVPDATTASNNYLTRITGFTFDGNGFATRRGVEVKQSDIDNKTRYIRIDNNKFIEFGKSRGAGVYWNYSINLGLVDNNTFIDNRRHVAVYAKDSYSWERWGSTKSRLGSAYAVYIEDNIMTWTDDMSALDPGGATYSTSFGAAWVSRFNTINSYETTGAFYGQGHDAHGNNGTDTKEGSDCPGGDFSYCANNEDSCCTRRRGVHFFEVYNDSFNEYGDELSSKNVDQRGATAIIFDNTDNNTSANIQVSEEDYPDDGISCSGTIANWEDCSDVVRDSYHFNNVKSGGYWGCKEPANQGVMVEPDYNYFKYETSFDGSTGVGRGIKASMPGTCKTGVGFWATDQGEWNSKNPGADGQLYKCTSTNTWELYYTPYSYPHPLRTGTTGTDPDPDPDPILAPPQNLRVAEG